MIDLDSLTPGSYRFKHGVAILVPPKRPTKRKSRCGIVEPEVTFAVRRDFRAGLSYRALARKYKLSLSSIRMCLRGDLYVGMIAEKEGLEPTLAAVCLVGRRAHLQPPNARKGTEAWYDRATGKVGTPAMILAARRAKRAEYMRKRRAMLKQGADNASHT